MLLYLYNFVNINQFFPLLYSAFIFKIISRSPVLFFADIDTIFCKISVFLLYIFHKLFYFRYILICNFSITIYNTQLNIKYIKLENTLLVFCYILLQSHSKLFFLLFLKERSCLDILYQIFYILVVPGKKQKLSLFY